MTASNFFHHRLANGLEVVSEAIPSAKSVSIGFFVGCGAACEEAESAGVSHFLEHMIFKGSGTRDGRAVNRDMDAIGASFNGCTEVDTTSFYASMLPERLGEGVSILADILRPAFREEDFRSEKKVILEEIHTYEDEPPFRMDEQLLREFYGQCPLGNSVLGSVETVRGLTLSRLREHFSRWYFPGNVVFCACGRVDFGELVEHVEGSCGGWAWADASCARPDASCSSRDVSLPRVREFRFPNLAQEYLLGASPACGNSFRERVLATLLARMLNSGCESRLYWEIVDAGLADEASISPFFSTFSPENGLFWTHVACDPGNADTVAERLERILRDVTRGGLTEKGLRMAKIRFETEWAIGGEQAEARMFAVGPTWLAHREYYSLEQAVATLRSITLTEMRAYLGENPLTQRLLYRIRPEGSPMRRA